MELHCKQARKTTLKFELKQLKEKVVKSTEEADSDQLRQLRISNAVKLVEIQRRKQQLQLQAEKLQAAKERFQVERNRELNEFKNIFTAFNDKLKTDMRTDNENK